ncbi:YbaN family protein [Cetobacterium somerae]|uniref:YbaN family protein n=1 Tax=Cetobacterium somerae TaxID=188913 RepID=UPI003D768804
MKKKFYFILGCISVILGVIGIVLPLLPTTPFILLSAFLFEKSSPKFHQLLLTNKIFGKYIEDYTERNGLTYKNKIIAITIMTLGMGKGFFAMQNVYGRIFLLMIFLGVLIHLLKLKTLRN